GERCGRTSGTPPRPPACRRAACRWQGPTSGPRNRASRCAPADPRARGISADHRRDWRSRRVGARPAGQSSSRPEAADLPDPTRRAPPECTQSRRPATSTWDFINFRPSVFQPDPAKSEIWNRGAYLVEGLGHCGTCHTPKNITGGDREGQALRGALLQDWYAPDVTP